MHVGISWIFFARSATLNVHVFFLSLAECIFLISTYVLFGLYMYFNVMFVVCFV